MSIPHSYLVSARDRSPDHLLCTRKEEKEEEGVVSKPQPQPQTHSALASALSFPLGISLAGEWCV